MDAILLMGKVVKDSRYSQKIMIPSAVLSWLYFVMHRMITHLWRVLSTA